MLYSRITAVAFWLLLLTLTAPAAWAVDPGRQLKQLHHQSWTVRDGLPFAGVRAVTQTPDGFLWFASEPGHLYRFDGVQAVPVATEQLGNRTIDTLATDARGDLWMGFVTPQIARLTRNGLEVFDVPTTGLRTNIFAIVPDPDGSLWVATRDKVHHFDGRHWREMDDPWPLTSSAYSDPGGVWGLALGRDGTLWSKNLSALYYLRRGANAFEQAPGYGGGLFNFATDAQGRLWTSDFSSGKFYRLPDLTSDQPIPPPQYGSAVPEPMSAVFRLDRDGTVWNGNRTHGFLYHAASLDSPAPAERFTTRDGLTGKFPLDAFEDREGNIWIPTGTGLDRFRNAMIARELEVSVRQQAVAMVATSDALFIYSGMPSRIPDPDGDAGGRLIRIRPGQKPEIVDPAIGALTGIAAAPDGSLVLSREGELLRWRDGESTRIAMPPELQGGHVVNLVATAGGIFVSFYQKGVHRLSEGTWTNITPSGAEPQDTANVAVDANGAAWVLYWSGRVVRVEAQGSTEFRSPVGVIEVVLPDPEGMIFVGARGIARFDGRTLQSIPASRVPILNLATGIAQSGDDVWIATASGILRIGRAALLDAFAHDDAPFEYRLYDASDGYTGMANTGDSFSLSMARGPDGRIWTFMSDGVGWLDPTREYRNTQPPPVVITSLVAQKLRFEMPRTLSLPAGMTQLQIDYTAPSLAMPERVRFRYKLDGVDEGWVEAGDRRRAFYTSLPPGEHRFRVIAANESGVWSEQGASLEFTIAPTFIQSIWFKLILATVLALLMWLMYRALLNQQAARLHKRFQIRIAERERIARELHDTLLQSVQGLILRFEAVAGRVPNDSALYASVQEEVRRAEGVVAEGRDRVRELRTRSKADLGRSIVEMSREIIRGEVPQLSLKEDGPPRVLHAIVRDEMALIATEAVRNAVNHASASVLEIELVYGDADLRMLIQDDGIGIPQEVLTDGERPGHFGLTGMRERAQRIGGRLRIYEREGGGTVIALSVPARAAYSDRERFLKRMLFPRKTAGA